MGNFLAAHRETFWFSNYTNKFYFLPYLAVLNRVYRLPILGSWLTRRLVQGRKIKPFPRPSEGDAIYFKNCKLEDKHWITENELTLAQKDSLHSIVDIHRLYSGGSRFINDESANVQRIRQIAAIFPGAYFIQVIRDGRAVANEIFQTRWWQVRKLWWFGSNPGSVQNDGPEPILLCALGWKYAISCIRQNRELYQDRYLEIRYEDLVSQPKDTLHKVLKFCELGEDENFFDYIPTSIPSNNDRWHRELSQGQKDVLHSGIGDFLKELNYL